MGRIVASAGSLLDALQRAFPDSSKTTLRKMLQSGRVRVNGETEKDAKRLVGEDDLIDVAQKSVRRALAPGLTILHEDDQVIVVLKLHGLLTVATERERENTAQAYLNAYLGEKGEGRIHVVHRLDRDTSGVLVFAKDFATREALKEQFAAHDVDRLYIAVVEGSMHPAAGTIRSHLLERRDLRMQSVNAHRNPVTPSVSEAPGGLGGAPPARPGPSLTLGVTATDAKLAVTHYRTISTTGAYSMLEVTLETGRKNQIRAHLSEAGHPVVGDQLYGSSANPLGRLGLHAKLVGFLHPAAGKRMTFTAPVPKSFRDLLRLPEH